MITEKGNNTNGLREIKAGSLARVFSQLDPNTSVYNDGEGSFIVAASDEDINKLADFYGVKEYDDEQEAECCCNCNTCEQHDIKGVRYGIISKESAETVDREYSSGDIVQDMYNMDTDFANYYADKTTAFAAELKNAIGSITDKYACDVIGNLCDYQNSKNYRTEKEMIRLVDKGEF